MSHGPNATEPLATWPSRAAAYQDVAPGKDGTIGPCYRWLTASHSTSSTPSPILYDRLAHLRGADRVNDAFPPLDQQVGFVGAVEKPKALVPPMLHNPQIANPG